MDDEIGEDPVILPKTRFHYRIYNPKEKQGHSFGINSLAIRDASNTIFTAGRDSSLQIWDIEENEGKRRGKGVLGYHTHWINDIALVGTQQETLVSCSSDCTVKIWRLDEREKEEEKTKVTETTLRKYHVDYVKALAYARGRNSIFSAGLDSNIYLWDIAKEFIPITHIAIPSQKRKSIYCLATNSEGNLLLSGSSERILSVWDVRTNSQEKIMKLRGHTDNIKAVILSEDSEKCLTCSADSTVKLWDMKQQRCVQTFEIHNDSVWSILVPDLQNFSEFYSAGKDLQIFKTELTEFNSELIGRTSHPVLKMVGHKDSIYCSSTGTTIKKVDLKPRKEEEDVDIVDFEDPEGKAGIIEHHILNNKRKVLTKDEKGNVDLWDIYNFKKEKSYGPVSFDEKVKELCEETQVPNWFSVDTATGGLIITMEYPQCFYGDIHLNDIDPDAPLDKRVNLGNKVLKTLFSPWIENRTKKEEKSDEEVESPREKKEEKKESEECVELIIADSRFGASLTRKNYGNGEQDNIRDLAGRWVPIWITDAILKDKLPANKNNTIPFVLHSANEKQIASLGAKESKLTSPRLFRISKIIDFLSKKLDLKPITVKGTKIDPSDYIQITCNGKVLSNTVTMGTVKAFVWKSGDEMILKYQINPNLS